MEPSFPYEVIDGQRFARERTKEQRFAPVALFPISLVLSFFAYWVVMHCIFITLLIGEIASKGELSNFAWIEVLWVLAFLSPAFLVSAVRGRNIVRRREAEFRRLNPDAVGTRCILRQRSRFFPTSPVVVYAEVSGTELRMVSDRFRIVLHPSDAVVGKQNTFNLPTARGMRTFELLRSTSLMAAWVGIPKRQFEELSGQIKEWEKLESDDPSVYPPIHQEVVGLSPRDLFLGLPILLIGGGIAQCAIGWFANAILPFTFFSVQGSLALMAGVTVTYVVVLVIYAISMAFRRRFAARL